MTFGVHFRRIDLLCQCTSQKAGGATESATMMTTRKTVPCAILKSVDMGRCWSHIVVRECIVS